jgi:hypothetical protein
MSAFVRLSTKLPGDPETNGVDALADVLVDDPATIRYAVVWFDVAKVTAETDTGDLIPTIRVRRIEPIGTAAHVDPAIADAVAAAVEDRTGRKAIPFAIVEVETTEAVDPDQMTLDVEAS